MAAGEKRKRKEVKAKKISKKRPARQGVGFVFPKLGRFSGLPVLGRGKIVSRSRPKRNRIALGPGEGDMIDYLRNSQPTQEEIRTQDPWEWTRMELETGAIRNFWRDPDAKFCCICGDGKDKHLELMCPYNYLSPASYIPCRAQLVLWNDEINSDDLFCSKHKRPSQYDKVASRRRKFLRCFVRVNNLAECCRAEQLVRLFSRFGPLRMYHVAMRTSEICGGFGYMVFERREHAEKAIDKLNCYNVEGRNLRVDWAYPTA